MNANDYKKILINAYKVQELRVEDFENTLMHFAGLCIKENRECISVEKELLADEDAKPVLLSRCGFSAINFNLSKVFCSILWVGKKYLHK